MMKTLTNKYGFYYRVVDEDGNRVASHESDYTDDQATYMDVYEQFKSFMDNAYGYDTGKGFIIDPTTCDHRPVITEALEDLRRMFRVHGEGELRSDLLAVIRKLEDAI